MPKLPPARAHGQLQADRARLQRGRGACAAPSCACDCYCPASGKCDLQRYGIEYEVFKNRFHGGAPTTTRPTSATTSSCASPTAASTAAAACASAAWRSGASCYDNMGRGFDSIVSTADNLPLQIMGCVSCGKCAETCPTGAIETNPRLLASYELDESRCIFCGECVEVCPYDALEQSRLLRAGQLQPRQAGGRGAVRARAKPCRPAA